MSDCATKNERNAATIGKLVMPSYCAFTKVVATSPEVMATSPAKSILMAARALRQGQSGNATACGGPEAGGGGERANPSNAKEQHAHAGTGVQVATHQASWSMALMMGRARR